MPTFKLSHAWHKPTAERQRLTDWLVDWQTDAHATGSSVVIVSISCIWCGLIIRRITISVPIYTIESHWSSVDYWENISSRWFITIDGYGHPFVCRVKSQSTSLWSTIISHNFARQHQAMDSWWKQWEQRRTIHNWGKSSTNAAEPRATEEGWRTEQNRTIISH